ncbi:HlyC/CorC family transporter [Lactobacillus sp. PV037]|uniref:hemolysin family protein n=1 Tax=unclassified Lactobacillus TaxID=2620435 RepID=UPI00223FB58E|nr:MULTISPECIES: hemolysin family protein [unclassified Lactobacillus]QNQ82597.1 HlyC/CorC family transporter [Lactobacillus sp. PV012]QNQ83288.1 HlyC/CorC family transporter [Lactobacillus sp. PV037]
MSSDPKSGNFLTKLKAKFHNEAPISGAERLEKEINKLYHEKLLSEREFAMVDGIINFENRIAREIMVPRIDAFMVDLKVPFQENLDEILKNPYSRIPVYDGDKDKIVGVIHIRTVLRKAREVGFDNLNYKDVMFKPLFAPETIDLGELLLEMQQTQRQLAILTDEYGGVVGLATIEDIIEEIVGDIDDEVDRTEILFRKINDRQYVIRGKMPLNDFNDEFGTHLEMEDVDTVAGYVITKLGLIPAKGEQLSVKLDNGMTLTTRRMKGSRILTLLLTLPDDQENLEKKEEKE